LCRASASAVQTHPFVLHSRPGMHEKICIGHLLQQHQQHPDPPKHTCGYPHSSCMWTHVTSVHAGPYTIWGASTYGTVSSMLWQKSHKFYPLYSTHSPSAHSMLSQHTSAISTQYAESKTHPPLRPSTLSAASRSSLSIHTHHPPERATFRQICPRVSISRPAHGIAWRCGLLAGRHLTAHTAH
jgi:hypothetical protein